VNEPAIRPAHAGEAAALSALTVRSKGHWGYDAAFLAAMGADLTLTEADIRNDAVYVIARDERSLGYCHLRPGAGNAVRLESLFVEPDAIGTGLGRELWIFAVKKARELGFDEIVFESDPHAESFYLALGAERTGSVESTLLPGRLLPSMHYQLTGRREPG